jgi:hypothetical protein
MRLIGVMNKILKKKFGFELHIVKSQDFVKKDYLWHERERFNQIYEKMQEQTVVDKERCYVLYQFLQYAMAIEGEIAEVGVYRGGTARLIAETVASLKRPIHLFDTFSGLPVSDKEIDAAWKGGEFGDTSIESVKKYLQNNPNINIHAGLFPQTAVSVGNKIFSFIHVDVDIYQSALDCSIFFYDRMARGAIMIFDDYGFIGCEGLKKAVDEFFISKPEKPIYLPTGQGLIIKI